MQRLSLRLFLARTQNRGLQNTINLIRYHTHHFFRYNSVPKMVNFTAVKTQKWLKVDQVWGKPYRYNLDPVNICNLSCPVCATGLGILKREQGKIHFDDYKKIVDQIAKYAYILELYNWGEPFLHPRIFDLIQYAHEKHISVRLSSNLNYFKPEMARKAVESGLDRIIVDVDGSTQEAYEKYRKHGKLAKVINNIQLLVEEKQRQKSLYPFILMRTLVNRYNEHQIDELRELAKDLGVDGFSTGSFFVDTTDIDQVNEWLPKDEAQSYYNYSDDTLENVWHCSDLWESMTINWDGGVAPCCWLHDEKNDFDNLLNKPLEEIWNGDAYVSSRRVFAFGGAKPSKTQTICTLCKGKPMYLKD